ncbi:MAG: hypothetical protein ABJA02_15665 [Acidobacteriota bacterium]
MRSKFLQLFLTIASVGILFISVDGQEVCPTLSVSGPGGIVAPGDLARYQVSITPLRRDLALTFNWIVSAGTIRKGQGTDRIDVLQPAQCITATVEVKGLPLSCPSQASETSCGDIAPGPETVIEISGTLSKRKLASIGKALIPFRVDQNAQVYVIIYGSRKSDFPKKHQAVQRLFPNEPGRVVFINSHSQQNRLVVWVVPAGTGPPVP